MLQPKFNPFFYQKFVFLKPEGTGVDYNSEIQKSDVAALPSLFNSASKAKFDQLSKKIEDADINSKVSMFDAGPGSRRVWLFLTGIRGSIKEKNKEFDTYANEIQEKDFTPEKQKELLLAKFMELANKINEFSSVVDTFCETEKQRNEMIKALKEEKKRFKAYFKGHFDKMEKEDQDKVVWEDLDKLIDAYMDRWVMENEKSINNMNMDNVKLLYRTLSNGAFSSGILYKDVERIKRTIFGIINNYWTQEGKNREVYKSDNWSKMDETWLSDNGFAKNHDPYFKQKNEAGLVPLPDGEDLPKSWKEYESPLVDKSLKPSEDKKVTPSQDGVTDKKGEAKGKPTEVPVKEGADKQAKPEVAAEQAQPKITEIKIDGNGIRVIGENLPKDVRQVKVDPRNAFTDIGGEIKSGVQNVDIQGNLKKIGNIFSALLRDAIKDGFADIKGVNSADVVSKIKDTDIENLRKGTLDKQKPKIIAWGTASMEGGFEANKRVALARAMSAKQQLEKENPGVQVEPRWFITGLDSSVTTTEQLAESEKALVERWNKDINSQEKVKTAQEVYAKLDKPNTWTPTEKTFFEENFLKARKVMVGLEYPKDANNVEIAMDFENTPKAATPSSGSLDGTKLASAR